MHKYKYLIKNIGILTISNFGTKILSFLLIPLYTSILSTEEYGTYDMYYTTVSLIIPILTLNVIASVMRYSLEEGSVKGEIFSIGLKKIVQSIGVFCILVLINLYFDIIPIFNKYFVFFILMFIGILLYDLLTQFSRGIERIFDVAIAGIISTVTLLGMNMYFLLFAKQGLVGYFQANVFAYFIPVIYLSFRLKIWKYIKLKTSALLKKEMNNYSKPLVFNTLAWWVNNVSDRYIITWFCGVAANGIYSVAYKIPSILNIFQSIFSQAWVLSAVKEYKDGNSSFYSNIYKLYNCGMVLVCSALILLDKFFARILFLNEFFEAWRYASYLMISVVFGALSGFLGGIFSAAKISDIFAKTTIMGASINTILNIVLVFKFGAVGAAIATMVSYVVVWAARIWEANKLVRLEIRIRRDVMSYIILILQAVIWSVIKLEKISYCLHFASFVVVCVLYFDDLRRMYNFVRKKY